MLVHARKGPFVHLYQKAMCVHSNVRFFFLCRQFLAREVLGLVAPLNPSSSQVGVGDDVGVGLGGKGGGGGGGGLGCECLCVCMCV